jgi:hypothetical protein
MWFKSGIIKCFPKLISNYLKYEKGIKIEAAELTTQFLQFRATEEHPTPYSYA